MIRHHLLCAATALAAAITAPAAAQGLSFNVGVVSLYKSNGIDQDVRAPKNFRPALQGGVDYDFGNGFYVGNWNSTGRFGNNGDADLEIDLYAGYRGEITKDVGYDVSVTRYIYPSDGGGWNGNELAGALSFGPVTVKLTNFLVKGDTDLRRLSVTFTQPVSDKLTFKAVVGKRNKANADGAADWGLGLAYDLGDGLSLSAMASGAQTSKVGDAGKGRVVVGLSKTF